MFHKKDRIIHFFKWLKCRQVKLLSAKYSFLIYANEIIYGNNGERKLGQKDARGNKDWKVMSIYLKEDTDARILVGLARNPLRVLVSICFF